MKLQGKYSLVIFALVLVVVMGLSGSLLLQFDHSMERVSGVGSELLTTSLRSEMEERGQIVARFTADSLSNPLYQFDIAAISEIIKTVQAQPDVVYAYVYDHKGILVHDGTKENSKANKPMEDEAGKKVTGSKEILLQTVGNTLDVSAPIILGNLLGGVRIGLSLEGINTQLAKLRETLAGVESETQKGSVLLIVIVAIIASVVSLGMAWLITRSLVKPIRELVSLAGIVGAGDFTVKVPHGRKDELGELASSFCAMKEGMKEKIRTINREAQTVAVCVQELLHVKDELDKDANRTLDVAKSVTGENESLGREIQGIKEAVSQATSNLDQISREASQLSGSISTIAVSSEEASQGVTTMASAAEQMSANIVSVNRSVDQVKEQVGRVSRAVDQLNNSMQNVRQRCRKANEESREADRQAKAAFGVMDRLSTSAREIGNVVEIIYSIADQTNMLALNAAIEAAGAGQAGKGFAVVANEIKALARQTADATQVIGDRISGIQGNTVEAGNATKEISSIIQRISSVNDDIAHAVDEQSDATGEIGLSIREVANAAIEVAMNVQELSEGATEVARNAMEAASGTTEIARVSADVARAGEKMADRSLDARKFAQSIQDSAERTHGASQRVQGMMRETFSLIQRLRDGSDYSGLVVEDVKGTSDALTLAQSGLSIGAALFDVEAVKGSHLAMVGQLHRLVSGVEVKVESGKTCPFLTWCRDLAPALPNLDKALLEQVIRADETLHQRFDAVVKEIKAGREVGKNVILSDFDKERRQFFALLDRLFQSEGM